MKRLVLNNLVNADGKPIVIEVSDRQQFASLKKIEQMARNSAQNLITIMASDPNNEGEIIGGSLRQI